MAEGWARHLKGDKIDAYSAGTVQHGLNQIAVQVMHEAGVNISQHRSKTLKHVQNIDFDYVITVCDNAQEACPVFPGKTKVVHHSFEDPPRLAAEAVSEDDAMDHYIRVRNEIRLFVETLPEAIQDF
jgi:arsenate reductase